MKEISSPAAGYEGYWLSSCRMWGILALQLPDMRDTGSPAARYEGCWLSCCRKRRILALQLPRCGGIVYLHLLRHIGLSFPSVIFIWRLDLSICYFHQSPLSVVFCYCILSFYYITLSSAIFTEMYQRRHIMSFASVVFLSHSHLSSSLSILNLSFTILSVIAFCRSLVPFSCHVLS